MTVLNLNKARKAKLRKERVARANENAVKFGRTKAQKAADNAERERAAAKLDGEKLSD